MFRGLILIVVIYCVKSLEGVLAALVDFFEIIHQWCKVVQHGGRTQFFSEFLTHQGAPIDAGAFFQNAGQELAGRFASLIVGRARILLQDLFSNVVVQLEQGDVRESIVIVLGGIVTDMGFGGGIAESFRTFARGHDPLVLLF